MTIDATLERGLPSSIDAERSILGSILLDNGLYDQAAPLKPDDFSLDAHRRIFARMSDLQTVGRPVDMITLAEELDRRKEVEAVGGVSYLSSLIDGVPDRPSIEHYVRIVRGKSVLRGAINIGQNLVAEAVDHSDEPEEVLLRADAALQNLMESGTSRGYRTPAEIMRESFGSLDALCGATPQSSGVTTRFIEFDRLTSGLQPSDLVILAARPSMGKTSFAMNIAENVAIKEDMPVGVFSLEMAREALLLRMVSSVAQVDLRRIRGGFLTGEERHKITRAAETLSQAPIYIDDTPNLSIQELRSRARILKRQFDIQLLLVDYLQLMSAVPVGGKRFENRTQEVSAISRGLKAIAKELKLPLLALSQLSRAPESRGGDHRPQLSDLRESGSIEQDADVVAFLFREEVYKKDAVELQGIAELIVAKQRNGPTDTVRLAWIANHTRFENLAYEQPDFDARGHE